MVLHISGKRPELLKALLAARDHEIDHAGRIDEFWREDLVEFATFVLLAEASGDRLALGASREPLILMLTAMTEKYRNPLICRRVLALVQEALPTVLG